MKKKNTVNKSRQSPYKAKQDWMNSQNQSLLEQLTVGIFTIHIDPQRKNKEWKNSTHHLCTAQQTQLSIRDTLWAYKHISFTLLMVIQLSSIQSTQKIVACRALNLFQHCRLPYQKKSICVRFNPNRSELIDLNQECHYKHLTDLTILFCTLIQAIAFLLLSSSLPQLLVKLKNCSQMIHLCSFRSRNETWSPIMKLNGSNYKCCGVPIRILRSIGPKRW